MTWEKTDNRKVLAQIIGFHGETVTDAQLIKGVQDIMVDKQQLDDLNAENSQLTGRVAKLERQLQHQRFLADRYAHLIAGKAADEYEDPT